MKQIIDINWKKEKDYFVQKLYILEDGKVSTIGLENFNFTWRLSKERFCIGYYEDGKLNPCINNAVISKQYERCMYCEGKQGFRAAFLFGQEANENAKRYLSQKHYIYLAYFEPGIIKVGTASEARKEVRLIEQDALIYSLIAESDGFKIQNLEKFISSNLGLTEKVSLKQKLSSIHHKPRIENAIKLIRQKTKEIRENSSVIESFSSWLIDKPEVVDIITKEKSLYFPEKANFEIEEEYLVGKFLGLRGRFLILENDGEVMLDKKKFIGKRIEDENADFKYSTTGPDEQISLI